MSNNSLEKCDEAIVSFVLSAEKDTVSNFVFELNGVYVQQSNGALTKRSSKNSYSVSLDVKDGILAYFSYNDSLLSMVY